MLSTANPAYTTEELLYQLKITGASVLIVQPESLETALAAASSAGLPSDRIILYDSIPGAAYPSLASLAAYGLSRDASFVERRLKSGEAKTKIAFYCFSSGTTGVPKVSLLR